MGSNGDIIDRVKEKQLILTVTAGRTGTTFLHNLFSLFPDVDSYHEADPNYVFFLRRVQSQPVASRQFLLKHKLPAIADSNAHTYAETSHLFCKGFLEPLINLGICPDIVVLRRNPREIARSYLERQTVPGRTALGTRFLVSPIDPNTLPMQSWGELSDYQLCYWYALEIERRQKRYSEYIMRLGGEVFDVTADELNNPAKFIEMAEIFSLSTEASDKLLERHQEVASVIHNKNPRELDSASIDFDNAEERVWERVSYYEPFLRAEVLERYRL